MEMRDFAREVARVLPAIHTELVRRQPEFLLKDKITFPQMLILNILGKHAECKMTDLARILGVTKSAVTGLTDRLIRSGLLRRRRSKQDRRVVNVLLTSKGLKQSKRFAAFHLKMIASLFSNISQNERARYLKILRKIYRNISSKTEYKLHG